MTLEGWRLTYLGANVPLVDVEHAVHIQKARVVCLSATRPESVTEHKADLVKAVKSLSGLVSVHLGGAAASYAGPELEESGMRVWDAPHSDESILRVLRSEAMNDA